METTQFLKEQKVCKLIEKLKKKIWTLPLNIIITTNKKKPNEMDQDWYKTLETGGNDSFECF